MELTLDTIRDVRIYQRKRGYRFSVDALLLYDFARHPNPSKIIDLGAGSGVIGILLAGRFKKAGVVLLELQEGLFELAKKNISENGLDDRVVAIRADISRLKEADLKAGSFDLAVSNPPFRKPATGKISRGGEKAVARHEIALSLDALVEAASYLLKNGGRFSLVYHAERLPEVFEKLSERRLEPKRLRLVHGKKALRAKIALIEAIKGAGPGLEAEKPFILFEDEGSYTEEAKRLFG
jgi:tRNA1Val (adenine37-N6)-methyltransferase